MNCRDFLNEFEDRNTLSETATLHLNDCVDCRKINSVQTRVWQVIDGFKPVEAPNDFDFRVKARIANAKPNDFRQPFFPVLRYVMGLSIVGLILAFVVFNGIFSFDNKTVPAIAENDFQPPVQKENSQTENYRDEQIARGNDFQILNNDESTADSSDTKPQQIEYKKESKTFSNKNQLTAVKSTKIPLGKPPVSAGKDNGGSLVSSLSTALPPLTPKGIPSSSQTIKNPSNFESANPITAEEILLQLGIEITLENGNRKVRKITQNSVAERSNVKVGDLIEAIDGEKLSSEPIRAKIIEGKKLTVVRGTEKVEIPLRY